MFEKDEHPRETTVEKLGKLPPVFKENGTVSAGNASVSVIYRTLLTLTSRVYLVSERYFKVILLQGICDGAGVVIVASEEACSKHNLTPLARLVAYDVVGVDPTIMGIGPAYAIQNVLRKAQMSLDNIDLVEVINYS